MKETHISLFSMQVAYYHIDDSITTRTFKNQLVVLGTIPSILKEVLAVKFWKNRTINYIIRSMTKIYLISEGLKSVERKIENIEITEKNKKEIEALYEISEKMLLRFRKLMSPLEKVNYFENEEMKSITEDTLANFYSFEAHVRQIAFSNTKNIDDKTISQFTSALSLGSLPA